MKEIKIHIAGPFGDRDPKSVTIIIDKSLPVDHEPARSIEDTYNEDALDLSMALFYSLPQGTFDRLIIKLLKRKVSSYRGLTRS